MRDGRLFPGELPYKDLQLRIRRWVQYIYARCHAGGIDQKGFGEFLGFEKSTINNLLRERELPGLLMFSRLVFRFRQWSANELLWSDPPDAGEHPTPLQLPSIGLKAAARK